MAIRQVRIGSLGNIHQYDDGAIGEAIDTDNQPIKIGQSSAADEGVRQDQLPGGPANQVSAGAIIADHKVVRGDGGTRAVQDSNVDIDDNGSIDIPTGESYEVNGTQVVTDQQPAEANAAAISAISLGAGGDTVDRTTFNTDLGTLVTEVNALRTTLNNLLSKLRIHGLINT